MSHELNTNYEGTQVKTGRIMREAQFSAVFCFSRSSPMPSCSIEAKGGGDHIMDFIFKEHWWLCVMGRKLHIQEPPVGGRALSSHMVMCIPGAHGGQRRALDSETGL